MCTGRHLLHAGDSDRIPRIADLNRADVAFLPISGDPIMTAQEAVDAVTAIRPKVAKPMHVRKHRGTEEDMATLPQHAPDEVVLLAIDGAGLGPL
jgi:L-ascorbate metabolism protein UlaG (beta-lactamase superfamily)